MDQTGIDGEAFAANQALLDAALQHGFEQAAQQVAVAEALTRSSLLTVIIL